VASLKLIPPIATHVTVVSSVHLSVCPSYVSYLCTKAIGRKEMPFGRDTHVFLSNIVLDRASVPHRKRRFEGRNGLYGRDFRGAVAIYNGCVRAKNCFLKELLQSCCWCYHCAVFSVKPSRVSAAVEHTSWIRTCRSWLLAQLNSMSCAEGTRASRRLTQRPGMLNVDSTRVFLRLGFSHLATEL